MIVNDKTYAQSPKRVFLRIGLSFFVKKRTYFIKEYV